jgi:hypothetical protein
VVSEGPAAEALAGDLALALVAGGRREGARR